MSKAGLASVGIPVYQGQDYLEETLSRLARQSYPSVEIVVSDNASTDRTPEIIDHFEQTVPIKRLSQTENIGAAENYNEVFRASEGEFFAWNAHDDFASDDFLASAVAALNSDPQAVVAVARPFRVDPEGNKIEELPVPAEIFESDSPAERFRAAARSDPEVIVFGLFRRGAIESTQLHLGFTGSDRNLVAEAMLYGRAVLANGSEFYLREHENRSVRRLDRERKEKLGHPREAWYAPHRAGKLVFPAWRRLGAYVVAVVRAPLGIKGRAEAFLAVGALLIDDGFKLSKYLAYDMLVALTTFVNRAKKTVR